MIKTTGARYPTHTRYQTFARAGERKSLIFLPFEWPLFTEPAVWPAFRQGQKRGMKTRSRGQDRTAGVGFESGRWLSLIDEGGF